METKRSYIDIEQLNKGSFTKIMMEEALKEGAELIRQGEVVAFPTETVYGLGADALNGSACEKIFRVKGRPGDNPLIVHVASLGQAKRMVAKWPESAEKCAQAFWPGPLTIVLPKAELVPSVVSGGLETVAVRMPSHPIALALIEMSGCPLAAPSANLSGKPSPTEGDHVWEDLRSRIPLLIDGGKSAVGLESTVLDLSGEIPIILRPGGVTREQLMGVLGEVEIDPGIRSENELTIKPKAPGMKYRHYAPKGEVFLLSGKLQDKIEKLKHSIKNTKAVERIALISMKETAESLPEEILARIDLLFILGSADHLEEAASRLFEGLRLCDQENINRIYAEEMLEEGIGFAFMNRLKKAAGKKDHIQVKGI